MSYEVELPDGTIVDVPDDVPLAEAKKRIDKAFPQFASNNPEKSGFVPALKGGIAGLKSAGAALAGRTGFMDPREAEAYRAEKQAESEAAFTPTQDGWTESPWLKFKELAGGSLPYMAAPLAAGAAAATLPVAAPAALLAGAGAGLAGMAQYTGTNLDRQLEEAQNAGAPTPVDKTDLGSAFLASIPQAALDVIGFRAVPLIRKLFTSVGKDLTEDAALALAKKGFLNTAKDYVLATGKASGTEGITESAQAFFERLQAGLSTTDASARAEFVENFIGGAVFGGAIAPAGRYVERMGEQQKAANAQRNITARTKAEEEKAATEQKAADQADPQYRAELAQSYEMALRDQAQMQTRIDELKKAAKTDPASGIALKEAIKARAEHARDNVAPLAREVAQLGGIKKLQAMLPLKPAFPEGEQQSAIPGMEPAGQTEVAGADPDAERAWGRRIAEAEALAPGKPPVPAYDAEAAGAQLLPRIRQAEQLVEEAQTAYSEADEQAAPAAQKRWAAVNGQLQALRQELAASGYTPPETAPKRVNVDALRKQRAAMRGSPAFDPEKASKLDEKIAAAAKTNADADKFDAANAEMQGADSDFFAPEATAARDAVEAKRKANVRRTEDEARSAATMASQMEAQRLQNMEEAEVAPPEGVQEIPNIAPRPEAQMRGESIQNERVMQKMRVREGGKQPDMFPTPLASMANRDLAGRRKWLNDVLKRASPGFMRDTGNRAFVRRVIDDIDLVATDAELFNDVEQYITSPKQENAAFERQRVERKLDAATTKQVARGDAVPAAPRIDTTTPAKRRLLAALERPARDADPAMLARIRDNVDFLAQDRPVGTGEALESKDATAEERARSEQGYDPGTFDTKKPTRSIETPAQQRAVMLANRSGDRGRDVQSHALRYITQGPQAVYGKELMVLTQALDLADEGKLSETEEQTQEGRRERTDEERAQLQGTSRGKDANTDAARYLTQGPQPLPAPGRKRPDTVEMVGTGEVKRGVQQELPLQQTLPGTPQNTGKAALFDGFKELDEFLASDALKDVRGEGDTAARVMVMLKPLQAKLNELQAKTRALMAQRDEKAQGARAIRADANAVYDKAESDLAEVTSEAAEMMAYIALKHNDALAKLAEASAAAGAKRPPKSFRKKVKVTTDVFEEDSNAFAQREVSADAALTALDSDISELSAFLKCLKG